ncbi:MAG: MSMEG_1061 family FMN-dependent PPOX-type flavoprotein [Pseudomonadota bacterium]
MYQPTHPVKHPEDLRAILGETRPTQIHKNIDHIDPFIRAWVERTPFVVIASASPSGQMDASPKGDPPGFVKVLDDKTLAIPDRIGNQRGDTFFNLLEDPRVGLIFIIPQRKEVVRINGTGQVVQDPGLLDQMGHKGHRPDLALVVRVHEAFYHCGKAMIRSRLWQPEHWPALDGLPTYAEALKRHAALPDPLEDIEEAMAMNERDRLY